MESQEFLKATEEQQDSMISETERQLYLAKQFVRYGKMQRLVKDPKTKEALERYRMQIIKLMEHEHV